MPAAVHAGSAPRERWREDPRLRHWVNNVGPAVVILVGQALIFHHSPFEAPGLYLYGIVLGLLSALLALGMALVYRANRILNFAQAELGLVPAVFAFSLMAYAHFPFGVALVLGLIGSLLIGGIVQTVIIERFAQAPRLILTVATIGLAQLLTLGSTLIPGLWGEPALSQPPFDLLDVSFSLAPITFRSGHIMALLVAPVVLAVVSGFLRYSNAGIAIRAAAERADRASLLGIPVARLNSTVWSVAALLSFTAVFLRGTVVGLPFSVNEGFRSTAFTTLLAALTALVLGRFTNLPAVAFSAVALGIAEQQLIYSYGAMPALVYPMYGLIILVTLSLRRVGRSRVDQDSVASWQTVDEIRTIPRELRTNPEVLVAKWGGLALLAYVAWRVPTFSFMEPARMLLVSGVVVFAIIGISIIVLTGWAGQVTLGQMGFVGVGAAVGAVATREWSLDMSVAIVLAGVAASVVAVIVGLPALRVRGLFLGITTLAFATTAAYYLLNPAYFAWIPQGRIERPSLFEVIDLNPPANMYRVCLVSLVLVILAVTGLRRSRTGRALLALRENERGAQSYGINTARAKLVGFALSGFCAGFAGCLYVHLTRSFAVSSFTATESFGVFTATVVGGLGGQTGAIIGALFSRGGTWFLRGSWALLPSAAGVLLVLLVLPGGFSGLLFRWRDRWLRSVARRFHVVVPSLMADVDLHENDVLSHAEEHVEEVVADAPGFALAVPAGTDRGPAPLPPPPAGVVVGAPPPPPSVNGAGDPAPESLRGLDGTGPVTATGDPLIGVPPSGDAAGPDDGASLAQLMLGSSTEDTDGPWWTHVTGGRALYPLLIMFGFFAVFTTEQATAIWLQPQIHDVFALSETGMRTLSVITIQFGLFLTGPIAFRADHGTRVRILLTGAALFAVFSLGSGLAPPVWWIFFIMRAGAAVGIATVLSTHTALIADHYDVAHRPKVYAVHGAAMGIGVVCGIAMAMTVGKWLGWRAPFFVLAVPTVALIYAGRHLHEPVRGYFERAAMGLTGDALELEEEPPSFEEGRRMVQRIESMRRMFFAMPFLAVSLIGFGTLASLFYDRVFHLTQEEAAPLEALANLGQLIGIAIAYVVGARAVRRDPARVIRLIFGVSLAAAGFVVLFAVAPNVPVALVARIGLSAMLAAILPAMFATLSLALPARARSTGFSVSVLYLLPGLLLILIAEFVGDAWGMRWGVVVMAPALALGGYLASTVHHVLDRDIRNVWTTTAARSELRAAVERGELKQLLVRDVDVYYGDVQILFGVDFEVTEGEIVALLGTNGAGKSTLLKAITGLVQPARGAIVFDGRDITASPSHETAGLGIAMVPGGQAVFPSLTVHENLKVAHWGTTIGARADEAPPFDEGLERVFTTFPILRERTHDPAANLSGGQQQMLALGMAFLSRPKLLVIDELSLGLAPVVVEQLLAIVREINDRGTTIILVEQSVNVALTLAETAYFMEKGEIRFHGATADLLERPDVLRSVFLEGAAAHLSPTNGDVPPDTGADTADPVDTPVTVDPSLTPIGAAPGGQSAAAIELVNLAVRFGGIRAVDGVSLAVAPGEILGIIGPNGAGKTTLFDLISGFTRADSGRVVLGGTDISHRRADGRARRGLGRSFQDARLFPALTVEDTIKVALERFVDARDPFNAMLRLPVQQKSEAELERRTDELIELLGIGAFRSKFVRELSTGSRRIVDLACVLAHRPSVVLLDEPSSGIAQRETEALGPLITRIRDALGASILLIEHDMPLVSSVSDRLLALDQGRVVVDGPASVVLNHPDVVASYLGNRDDIIARSGQRAV